MDLQELFLTHSKNIIKVVTWTSGYIIFIDQVIMVIYRFWTWSWNHSCFFNWIKILSTTFIINFFSFTNFTKFIIIFCTSWSFRICCCIFLFVLKLCTIFIFIINCCLIYFNQIAFVITLNFIINIWALFYYLFQCILISLFFIFFNISVCCTFIYFLWCFSFLVIILIIYTLFHIIWGCVIWTFLCYLIYGY